MLCITTDGVDDMWMCDVESMTYGCVVSDVWICGVDMWCGCVVSLMCGCVVWICGVDVWCR